MEDEAAQVERERQALLVFVHQRRRAADMVYLFAGSGSDHGHEAVVRGAVYASD